MNIWEKVEMFCRIVGLILVIIGFLIYGRTSNYDDGKYFVLAGILVQIAGLPAYYHNKRNKKSK